MNENVFKLTLADYQKIADAYVEDDHHFFSQNLEHSNKVDLVDWMNSDELVGLVSESHGGIIAYVNRNLAEDIVKILNIHAINHQMDKV